MGCDLRLIQEIKINNVWYFYNESTPHRNYELFSTLVENHPLKEDGYIDSPINIPQRGIPSDISVVGRIIYEHEIENAKISTYINSKEIKIIENFIYDNESYFKIPKYPQYFNFLFGNSWSYFLDEREIFPLEIQDIRWIYWFNN